MAVTFRGSVVVPPLLPLLRDNGSADVVAIVNTFRSRSKLTIFAFEQIGEFIATGARLANEIMLITRLRRCPADQVSGGAKIIDKVPWDRSLTSDDGIKFYFNPGMFGEPSTEITTGSLTAPMWNHYTTRQITGVEQFRNELASVVPEAEFDGKISLLPGEALIVQVVANLPIGGQPSYNIGWEEESVDAGYTIAGNVKLDAVNVAGARVLIVTDSVDQLSNNPELEVVNSDGSGNFSKVVATNVKASVFVQHKDGATKYTDEGKPYIES